MFHNSFSGKKYCGHRRAMGHVLVELKDSTHDEVASVISRSKRSLFYPVMCMGHGMSILFADIPGKFENKDHVIKEIQERSKRAKVGYIKFELNENTYRRLQQYLTEYKEKGYDKIYNGKNLPREGKGAGCSALSYSFIELGNLMDTTETNRWVMSKCVPACLLGGPDHDHKRISCLRIMHRHSWADTTTQQYCLMNRYDPLLMYEWVVKKNADKNTTRYYAEDNGHATGIVIDCRHIPTPQEAIWVNN